MIVLEVVFLTLFWGWVATAAAFLRSTLLPASSLQSQPEDWNLQGETIRFDASDGATLEAWAIRCQNTDAPWILCVHGLHSNRSELLSIALALHQAGFQLLLLDLRAHGGSPGRSTSFGWTEQRDLEGALAWMGQQPDLAPRPYGFFGVSIGAVAGLELAASDERLGVVAVDSPYTSLKDAIADHLKRHYPWAPRSILLPFIAWTYRLRFGVWPERLAPIDHIERLSPRPLLIIHGEDDKRVPVERAKALYACAGGKKEFWLVKGVGPMGAYNEGEAVYNERLVSFFRTHLRGNGTGRPPRRGGLHGGRQKTNSSRR